MRTWPLILLLLPPSIGLGQREVFNDNRPETKALELWRMTRDPQTRHHSVYHDTDPFNFNGRYLLYVVGEAGAKGEEVHQVFAIYDLALDKEIWRSSLSARRPIWAHHSNRVFWGDGAKGKRQNVWQVELPEGKLTKLCDDARNAVMGLSPDEQWLFWTLNTVYHVRTQPGSKSEVAWQHPEAPKVSSSSVCHNPTHPVYQVRQNFRLPGKTKKESWGDKHPARMLVTDDGRALGPAQASLEKGHGAWRGDGEYILVSDGLMRGRRWDQAYPVPLLAYGNTAAHDPSPCGRSGQWTCTTAGINELLKVFDWRTTDTTLISYSCSTIHQPLGDDRDLSGPYDSDAFGSPDGTKIYFSSNYQLDQFPVTQVTQDAKGDVIEVLNTDGFPDKGLLSIHVGIVSYTGKTRTSFTGITRGALGSRLSDIHAGAAVSDFRGRADMNAANPLAAQYATDVYLAVVRLPDQPELVRDGNSLVLYPGFNHREIRGYWLYADGRALNQEPWDGAHELAIPSGANLTAVAVEWSGLKSASSRQAAIPGPGSTVRYEANRPAELDRPRKELWVVQGDGRLAPAPAGTALNDVGQMVVRYLSSDGVRLAEEALEHGTLVRRTEYTTDGRATLVQEYAGGVLSKRVIRDPGERLRRIEYLAANGYLTAVEDYSGNQLGTRTEYRNGEPARRTLHHEGRQIVQVNDDGHWIEAK